MLLNLSNHPKSTWGKKQTEIAIALYGTITDINFPAIDPEADEKEIHKLTKEYFEDCKKLLSQSTDKNNAVHIMGEMTFCFTLIKMLQQYNIKCIASTTRRIVTKNNSLTKTSRFEFVQFRKYPKLKL
ncbi:MAG: CRISPR-associated protein [Bacteroidota bacterium]|nr:CRISPR-associated protein [Bacteroidota bacterium]